MKSYFLINLSILEQGLEDDDILEDIVKEPGMFLANVPTLGILKGMITIHRDFDESVFILLGSLKNFEHFHVHRSAGDNFLLPKGKMTFI